MEPSKLHHQLQPDTCYGKDEHKMQLKKNSMRVTIDSITVKNRANAGTRYQ